MRFDRILNWESYNVFQIDLPLEGKEKEEGEERRVEDITERGNSVKDIQLQGDKVEA